MGVAVAGDLVTLRRQVAQQRGHAFHHPAEDEEGGPALVALEQVCQTLHEWGRPARHL